MHGPVHDWVTLNTILRGKELFTGETWGGKQIKFYDAYKMLKPLKVTIQRKFKKVLEIGSLDVNGSQNGYDFLGHPPTWNELAGVEQYIGIDKTPGKGVDHVMNAHQLAFKDNEFDLILCLNMLEHDEKPKKTLKEAFRVLKKGGLFILTCSNPNDPPHHEGYFKGLSKEELLKMMPFKKKYLGQIGGTNYVYGKK